MPVDLKQISSVELFEGLSQEQLVETAARCRIRPYKTEVAIINQDDSGDVMYIILHGIVKVFMSRADGRDVFLAVLGKGEHFGELSMIDSDYRSANVVTQEETSLLHIDRRTFEYLMLIPKFALNLCRSLAIRFRRGNERVGNLARMSVQGLVAHHILEFANSYGQKQEGSEDIIIPIRLTQNDLADLVGASRERVNQVVRHLKDSSCISVNLQYRITVHKLKELQKWIDMQ